MGMNPELPGVNMYITTCLHGVDLRFTPRCYLCKPWPDDSPVWKVTSPGHVHEGEWCAMCVEHGRINAALEEPTPVLLRLQHAEPLYTEDDPDWSDMVSPISEKDGGHDDR
jgi:hypothetical protein